LYCCGKGRGGGWRGGGVEGGGVEGWRDEGMVMGDFRGRVLVGDWGKVV